jgi:glutamyl/glutaminyl-tRNA synthetase
VPRALIPTLLGTPTARGATGKNRVSPTLNRRLETEVTNMLHVHASVIRPVEESLREFENMRNGKYRANEATLRMKMDMLSPNPNMWDQV